MPRVEKRPMSHYSDWRSDASPAMEAESITFRNSTNRDKYRHAMAMMEHSVEDLALEYVTRSIPDDPFADKLRRDGSMELPNASGPLLHFASTFAQRYMDLLEAYIALEIEKGIPMIPVTAGQMKQHGFTSEDIIAMQPGCQVYSEIVDKLGIILDNDPAKLATVVKYMVDDHGAESAYEGFCEKYSIAITEEQLAQILEACSAYQAIDPDQAALIGKAHFLMENFGRMTIAEIIDQLTAVAGMVVSNTRDPQERVLMEIRHRVAGDSSFEQTSPGSLGGNPLAYLNLLKSGEPGNPLAEFRGKMYFVYMLNHFANAVMASDLDRVNSWLVNHSKGWQIDPDFVAAMQHRGKDFLPPIFRYGANADLNGQLRVFKTKAQKTEFYEHNHNITVRQALNGTVASTDYFRVPLSCRELLNQTGDFDLRRTDLDRPLNFVTGAGVFQLNLDEDSIDDPYAKQYVKQVKALDLPVWAGISGTLDQSTTMAGLVGLGTDLDKDARELELHLIKLAYLAFMLPGRDHSVHEILQSSKTFGLPYVAGPGYWRYIFPYDQGYVQTRLEALQGLRNAALPDFVVESLSGLSYQGAVLRETLVDKDYETAAEYIIQVIQQIDDIEAIQQIFNKIGIGLGGRSGTDPLLSQLRCRKHPLFSHMIFRETNDSERIAKAARAHVKDLLLNGIIKPNSPEKIAALEDIFDRHIERSGFRGKAHDLSDSEWFNGWLADGSSSSMCSEAGSSSPLMRSSVG